MCDLGANRSAGKETSVSPKTEAQNLVNVNVREAKVMCVSSQKTADVRVCCGLHMK